MLGAYLAIHFRREPAAERLFAYPGFRSLARTELEAIVRGRVVLRAAHGVTEPADAVVLVSHPTANRALADELAASFDVTSWVTPRARATFAAVADGNRVGRAL